MSDLSEAMAQFLDILGPVRDASLGYRRSLLDAGVSADVADMMAADFHHFVINAMAQQLAKQ